MLKHETLDKFADLVLQVGVNLQVGQGLEVACPTSKREVAVAFTRAAYKLGAKIVRIRWSDEEVERLNYECAQLSALTDVPKWFVDGKMDLVKNGFCYVAISAENPKAFEGVDAVRLSKSAKARAIALKKFSNEVMSNGIRWCVVSVPTLEWAKLVFPTSSNPESDLSNLIEDTMRLNEESPVDAWKKHIETLNKRANFLNESKFTKLIFTNSLGTNLSVGLCEDAIWLSAEEVAKDGIKFVANMPTEEVFTAPHKDKVDGIVKSALPLCENGTLIKDFSLTFKNGKIVDFYAKEGYETLKELINTDNGTKRLGEVALIGKNSPIAKRKVLLYNTLFDENASCHLAIGEGYPTTVKNGANLTKKELNKKGLNNSNMHVDFMIGTPDLNVVGVKENGEKVQIFIDGEWAI